MCLSSAVCLCICVCVCVSLGAGALALHLKARSSGAVHGSGKKVQACIKAIYKSRCWEVLALFPSMNLHAGMQM